MNYQQNNNNLIVLDILLKYPINTIYVYNTKFEFIKMFNGAVSRSV